MRVTGNAFCCWKDEDKRDLLDCGRPTESFIIKATKEVKKSGKSYGVNFKRLWFKEFPWLCSSPNLQKLFCWPCLLFSSKSNVWSKEGFADLLNMTRSLHKHLDSAEHIKCQLKLTTFERKQNTIAHALKENDRLYTMQFNENVRMNRLFLQIVIDAALYLCKQELAFSGHNGVSTNRGNFKELLVLLMSRSPVDIQNHYTKIKDVCSGDSETVQSEIIGCISNYINDYVKYELRNANCFSFQVDDVRDIIHTSQCSITVRFINSEGTLVQRFLGFFDVSANRSSENLFSLLNNILEPFDYQLKLVGHCYDGKSVLSEHLDGLREKIKRRAPLAVFVHSLAYRLDLILQQSFTKIPKCSVFFDNIDGITPFFHHSPKKTYGSNIPIVTTSHWNSTSELLGAIVDDWEMLKLVFETIVRSEDFDGISIQLARGFLHEMNSFEFTFLTVVFHDIFCLTDILYDILQEKKLDVDYCLSKLKSTCDKLRNRKTEQYFLKVYGKASSMTKVSPLREYDVLPQDDVKFFEVAQSYQALYFQILDHILMEIEVRFCDLEKLQFFCLVDSSKFDKYHKCFPFSALENLRDSFGVMFPKTDRLKNELTLLYGDENYRNVSVEEMAQMLHEVKNVFTDAYKLFSLILCIPSTVVSVEGDISCIKGRKTYLRNVVSQEKFSSLANIAIQKELLF